MNRVTPFEILRQHYTGKLFQETDNINLIAITPTHSRFPDEPVNIRTGKKYQERSLNHKLWRYAVRKLSDTGPNTEMLVRNSGGNQVVVKYQRESIASLANNVKRFIGTLEVEIKLQSGDGELSRYANRKNIHNAVADLLVAIPCEIECLELIKAHDELILKRKLKYVTVVPACPLSLLYSYSPITVRVRIKYL